MHLAAEIDLSRGNASKLRDELARFAAVARRTGGRHLSRRLLRRRDGASKRTERGVRRLGLAPAQAGWLVEAGEPLTEEQIDAAREMAVETGITVEARDPQRSLAQLRAGPSSSARCWPSASWP
jgi:hypothetical protein